MIRTSSITPLPAPKRGRPRKNVGAEPSADQIRRLRFIERAAIWTGQIGRRAVATTFDVSIGHVTADFQRYREMAPRNLNYDISEKCFRPTEAFEPVFGSEEPASILNTIAATTSLEHQDRARLLGFDLSVDAVEALPAAIDRDILVAVCRSITAGTALEIDYQSMTTGEPIRRIFAPRSLIFTGQRWLTRGWDNRHSQFRDMALARILTVHNTQTLGAAPRDIHWHDRTPVVLTLRKDLSAGQKAVTAREFGMRLEEGCFSIRINPRQAMIPYILDHYRLRPSDPPSSALPIRLSDYQAIRMFDRQSR